VKYVSDGDGNRVEVPQGATAWSDGNGNVIYSRDKDFDPRDRRGNWQKLKD
jgi:hypothetical protein